MINLRSIAYILFFFSGFAALTYQVVWTRQFIAIYGSTAESSGVVLASFMAGLAIGGMVLGRIADRVKRLFLFFGILEGLIGVCGLLSPFGFGIVSALLFSGGMPSLGMKITLSVIYMIVPCFLIGGTLPVLSRFCLGEGRNYGLAAGGLYATNTLGAAAGAVATGFWFLEHLGAFGSIRAAGFINLAVAAAALILFLVTSREDAGEEGSREEPGEPDDAPPPKPFARIVLYGAFFLAGASTLAHEVIWTRILSQYFKSSVYSFAAMLFAVLVGLAVGGGAASWLTRFLKRRQYALGLAQMCAGLSSMGTVFLLLRYNDLTSYMDVLIAFGGHESFGRLAFFEMLASLGLVALPAFLMGMSFPLIAHMAWRPASRFAGFIGDVQFVLTLGGVFGALVMAFVLIPQPRQELLFCLKWAFAANFLAGILLIGNAILRTGWAHRIVAAACLVLGVLLYLLLPEHLFFWKDAPEGEVRLFYMSDRVAEIAVVETGEGRILKVNGKMQGGTGGEFLETRLGMIPLLLKGASERALVMGLGTGNTLAGLLFAGAKDVDCVELSEGVVTAAKKCFHAFEVQTLNGGRLRFIMNTDARYFLQIIDDAPDPESGEALFPFPREYDLIIGDLYFPWQAEAGFLYTKEHFERVLSRLSDDGLFFQWLPLHQLRWEDFGIIGYTFSEIFPHVAIFLAAPNAQFPIIGLAGSKARLKINPETMQEALDNHPQRIVLERFELGDAMEILALYMGNEWRFRSQFEELVFNTEDRTLVEFRAARTMEGPAVLSINNFFKLSEPQFKEDALGLLQFPAEMEGTAEKVKIQQKVKNTSEALRYLLSCQSRYLNDFIIRLYYQGNRELALKDNREKMGRDGLNAFRMAPDFRLTTENIIRLWRLYLREGQFSAANNLLFYGLEIDPENDGFCNKFGLGLLMEGRYEDAANCLEGAIARNEMNYSAKANLAITLFLKGERVKAREVMEEVKAKIGYERLQGLTGALARLILEGLEEAEPFLAPYAGDPSWEKLVKDARRSAEGSARERGAGEKGAADK